ncbi:MAG TPA: hypothetical protein VF469_33720, partial [Kofleriaceae bacterium]
MIRDREGLRAELASPRSEAARDAARELGAAGTLDDVAPLEKARAAARLYYEELAAPLSGPERLAEYLEKYCATAYLEEMNEAWNESVGPFEEGLALLQARLHPD